MGLWTTAHAATLLPAAAVMVLLALLLRKKLKDKPFETRMIPIKVIAVILVLIEIGKQVISLIRGYDLYHLPFHFCSLFLFMLPAAAFYRGKHRNNVFAVTAALLASVGVLMMIYPSLIYESGSILQFFTNYFAFHTVFFHNLVLLALILIPALDLMPTMNKASQRSVILFLIIFSVVAAIIANLLQTNFHNMYECNVPALESIRLAAQSAVGYVPAQIFYCTALTLVGTLFVLGCYQLLRPFRKFSRTDM